MKDSRKGGVLVQDAEDLYEAIFDKVSVLANGPLSMTKRAYNISGRIILYKEISSVIVAAAGLLLALPIMILTAIAIRLDSPGPAIFRQNRVGKKGQIFTLYKFRSMRQGVDRDGISPPAQKNDSRFTRVGRLIRRTRIDELPQLWNIVRGDMYLVGPRPFTVDMEDSLSRKIPDYGDRWLVKPGVTGWAQIRRPYCTSVEDNIDKLAHDLFYIKNMSVGFDLLIIFETFKILLLGRGAQ
jgi:lipopolysaccharide/colanic/teichoic acid biosynthesis glycosyltransferase